MMMFFFEMLMAYMKEKGIRATIQVGCIKGQ